MIPSDGQETPPSLPDGGNIYIVLFARQRRFRHSRPYLTLVCLVTFCLAPGLFGQTAPSSQAPSVRNAFDTLARSATGEREAGKTVEAIADYRRALELRQDWQEGWWYLGTLQYDSDHYAEAVPAFQKLTQLAPAMGSVWNFLGLCEFETKDYANSMAHLEKGQVLGTGDDPEVARVAKYHLAPLLNRNGEFERASAMLVSAFGQRSLHGNQSYGGSHDSTDLSPTRVETGKPDEPKER